MHKEKKQRLPKIPSWKNAQLFNKYILNSYYASYCSAVLGRTTAKEANKDLCCQEGYMLVGWFK